MKVYLTNANNPNDPFLEAEGTIKEIPSPHLYRVAIGGQDPCVMFGRLVETEPQVTVLAVDHDALEKYEGYTIASTRKGDWRIWRKNMVLAEVEHERVRTLLQALHAILP